MIQALRSQVRRAQLSSDARAGRWARNEARRRQWAFVRTRWQLLSGFIASTAAVIALLLVLIEQPFLAGFAFGAVGVGTAAALAWLVTQATGTAQMTMGADAEQWTASELRPLRRHGWRLLNHVALRRADIDHVLVGPGGLVIVETKWSGRGWSEDNQERLRAAVESTRDSARLIALWQPVRSMGVRAVEPAIFLWGGPHGVRPHLPQHRDGVALVVGPEAARTWRRELLAREPVLDDEEVEELWGRLEQHMRRRDAHDERRTPSPPSVFRLYVLGWVSIATALAGFMLVAKTYLVVDSWVLRVCAMFCYAGAAALTFRNARVRFAAMAWSAGLITAGLLIAALIALSPRPGG